MAEARDLAEGRRLRDEGIERVARARADWLRNGRMAITLLRRDRLEICSFDVWYLLDAWNVAKPPEPRVMGRLLQICHGEGLITPTDRYLPSPRPIQHAQPCRVWRSTYTPPKPETLAQLPLGI